MPEEQKGEVASSPEIEPRKRILVVDDEKQIREMAKIALLRKHEGYDVILAENGQKAWEELEKPGVGFDLVITDKDMDQRNDGLRLLKRIKGSDQESLRQIPVIMMSGTLTPEIAQEVQRLGAQTLEKPFFDISDLITVVELALESPPEVTKSS